MTESKTTDPRLTKIYSQDELNQKLQEQAKDFDNELKALIEHRDNERKNNNIFRKSVDELNDDFIEELERFRGLLKKYCPKEEGK